MIAYRNIERGAIARRTYGCATVRLANLNRSGSRLLFAAYRYYDAMSDMREAF